MILICTPVKCHKLDNKVSFQSQLKKSLKMWLYLNNNRLGKTLACYEKIMGERKKALHLKINLLDFMNPSALK